MKIEVAVKKGFQKGFDGVWRNPTKRKGGIVLVKYHLFNCSICSMDFLASHARNKFCSISCSMKERYKRIPIGNYWLGKKRAYAPRDCVKSNKINQHGYAWILVPHHPKANKKGYVAEHRYVMEQKIGRVLESREIVHHINENRSDNRIENLLLMTHASHNSIHKKEQVKNRKRTSIGRFI